MTKIVSAVMMHDISSKRKRDNELNIKCQIHDTLEEDKNFWQMNDDNVIVNYQIKVIVESLGICQL